MSSLRTSPTAPTVSACLMILNLSGCAGSSGPATAATSTSPSASPSAIVASTLASSSASPSPTAPAVDQTVRIVYAQGKVSGVGTRVRVKLGSIVALVVTSDVADEVHFHGYDKHADVAKGGTVSIVFKATIPGVFEVELEKLKHRLVLLQVQ